MTQRIYAACLASYNNGVLHGRWIEASSDVDEMQEQIDAMLRESRFPNVMVACEACQGSGEKTFHNSETGDTRQGDCPTCGGNGEVPSAEEWAIHDHEGLGNIGEYAGLEAVAKRVALAELADDRGIPLSVLMAFADDFSRDGDADDIEREIDDRYSSEFTNSGDWAAEQAESMGYETPDWIGCHIDWDGVARDWLMDYSQYEHDGTTYLFHAG